MKHLVKKYVRQAKFGEAIADAINNHPIDEKKLAKISEEKMEGYNSFGITNDNEFIQTFKYLEGDKVFLIPEPDPIIIYFDTAILLLKAIQKQRKELFDESTNHGNAFYAINGNHFYSYYSAVCNYVIFLFLSLEAFTNKIIPNEFEYKKPIQDKKTEIYDKNQIQRWIDFLEKVKSVVPQITNKNFVKDFGHKYDHIKKLKEFRDEIIHTKSFEGKTSQNFYEDLYNRSLSFNFSDTLLAVRDYINYHQENLIEECDCGRD